MASILIENSGRTVPASPAVSLLNNLLRAGVPIRHDCGGHARCGTCQVSIIEGDKALSPLLPLEKQRLTANNAPATARLACQTYTAGDVHIRIKNYGAVAGT